MGAECFEREAFMVGRRVQRLLAVFIVLAVVAVAGPAYAVVENRPTPSWQANGRVSVILRAGSKVFIGGSFTNLYNHAGRSVSRARIAAIDAVSGKPLDWNPGANGTVYAMALSPSENTLYVGGTFTTIDGESRNRIAAFDVATGRLLAFSANVQGGGVRAMAASGSAVFLGGSFERVDGDARLGLAAVDPGLGLLTNWYPGAVTGGRVRTLALPSLSRLVVGGSFDQIGGDGGQHLSAIDPATDNVLGWQSHPADPVITMASEDGSVYAGTTNNLANRYDASDGDLKFSKHGNGNVQALAVLNGILYIGGHFQEFAGRPEPHLAAANALSGSSVDWNASANSPLGVFALCGDGRLYMGGDFTRVTGDSQDRFAMFSN